MFVKPAGPRHTTTERNGELVIRIPAKRQYFMLLFLSFWLCGWLFGEISAIKMLFGPAREHAGTGAFMLVWLGGWTVGGGFAAYTWLWQVKGCEVITISSAALGIKHEVFGLGRNKQYDVSEIRHLRVAPLTYNPFDHRSRASIWGMGGGMLAFDYGFKTYRLGAGVDEAEARILLQTITARVPRLADATFV